MKVSPRDWLCSLDADEAELVDDRRERERERKLMIMAFAGTKTENVLRWREDVEEVRASASAVGTAV